MAGGHLTQDQALLRVAFLVAHADGRQTSSEMAAISDLVGERLVHLDGAQVEALAMDAVRDVSQFPIQEVLPRVRRALPDRQSRILALHVACEIARADKVLDWRETQHLMDIIAALGLKKADVDSVLMAHWTPA